MKYRAEGVECSKLKQFITQSRHPTGPTTVHVIVYFRGAETGVEMTRVTEFGMKCVAIVLLDEMSTGFWIS